MDLAESFRRDLESSGKRDGWEGKGPFSDNVLYMAAYRKAQEAREERERKAKIYEDGCWWREQEG